MLSLKRGKDGYELTDARTGECATLQGEDRPEVVAAWIQANSMVLDLPDLELVEPVDLDDFRDDQLEGH